MARKPDSTYLTLIDPAFFAYVLRHPARVKPWTVRELAETVGTSRATVGDLRSGRRRRVAPEVARRIAEAVGVHVAVLFTAGVSADSDTNERAA